MQYVVSPEAKEQVDFLIKRINEQRDYIQDIKDSYRSYNRKMELIDSANQIKIGFQMEIGKMVDDGLIRFENIINKLP